MRNRPPRAPKAAAAGAVRTFSHFSYRFFERWRREITQALFGLFFPRLCAGCQTELIYPELICKHCIASLPRIQPPYCKRCGVPFPAHWKVEVCPDCKQQKSGLHRVRSIFYYDGLVSNLIRDVKYSRRHHYLKYFATELLHPVKFAFPGFLDALVAVPMHRQREWERRLNQSEVLARFLSRLSGIPLWKGLIKKKKTAPQTSLSGIARKKNLANTFEVRGDIAVPRRILLIDDVITTGATLQECARTLRKAGTSRVYGLTIARAVLNS